MLTPNLEAPPRFELGNKGFADLCLASWLWRRIWKRAFGKNLMLYYIQKDAGYASFFLERKTRFELATFTLAR